MYFAMQVSMNPSFSLGDLERFHLSSLEDSSSVSSKAELSTVGLYCGISCAWISSDTAHRQPGFCTVEFAVRASCFCLEKRDRGLTNASVLSALWSFLEHGDTAI